jgi:hypothetical protein
MAVPVLVPHVYEALLIVFLHYGPVDSLQLIQCLVDSTVHRQSYSVVVGEGMGLEYQAMPSLR